MPMSRRVSHIIPIKPISIRIGDQINVKGYWHDVKLTRTGVVAKRDVDAVNGTTSYLTAQGVRIVEQYRDGTCDLAKVQVFLLNRQPDPTLF